MEFSIDPFRGVEVYRCFGSLFDCRRHLTRSHVSYLRVSVTRASATSCYDIAEAGAFSSLLDFVYDLAEVGTK